MTTVAARPAVRFEQPDADDGIARIVLDRPDDEVNAINPQLLDALDAAIRDARGHTNLRGLIVVSAKPNQWMAGADLKMVMQQTPDAAGLEAAAHRFQSICDELAWLPCTTVAAIGGPALGGGLELALACDYRVAAESASVSLGQSEVSLGIVPAGGGTQRLPRLLGLEAALDLILTGRRLNARRARRLGLVDEVVHPTVLEQAARAWATRPKRSLNRPIKLGLSLKVATDVAEQTPAGRQLIYRKAREAVLNRTHGHYPAPLRALQAAELGLEQGMAAGLDAEAKAFAELAATRTAHNLIWLFMATQRQKRLFVGAPRRMDRIGVVGTGFMGAAIAEVGADAGLGVRVRDMKQDAVAKGLASIRKIVDRDRRRSPRERRDVLQRVSGTTEYSGFAQTQLVIEAVFEDLEVKRNVIKELEAVLSDDAVIASNTSALPIHELATGAKHPERIVGMHFFSPAERMPLLEVIKPMHASDEAVATAVAVGVKMGKTVIVVGDAPGFYTTRVLGVLMNEAVVLLSEGARVEDVDRAMTAFGFPVGPFVLYDEVGLEVAQHAGATVVGAFGGRLPATTVVPQLVKFGATGKRSGSGFYLWPQPRKLPGSIQRFLPEQRRMANPRVYELCGGRGQGAVTDQEIQDRLVLLFVNEAMGSLQEGVLRSPTDGDLGAVLGLGFPPFHGGPFHYADEYGLNELRSMLTRLADRCGPRYSPAELLVERAQASKPFFAESS
jgi:3-hydroxyacyl-CoA dehydrogenase / enoyl-CoA hydratase / 3-hydroxybutyryl-CoA epimerase